MNLVRFTHPALAGYNFRDVMKRELNMNETQISQELIQKTIDFHGHSCPGLAIGIRASEVALREVGPSSDEEVVAVV